MKITRVRTRLVAVHNSGAADGIAGVPRTWPVVTLRLGTDQGVDGLGVAFTLGGLNRALLAALDELANLLVGEDPTRIEAILAKLRKSASTGGHGGLYVLAQAAIDIALWDIRGKMAGLPLWRLVGGARERIAAYSSGSVTRELDDEQAARAARWSAEQGFRWIKMHLALPGESSPRREIERARLVREALGPDIRLVCDINERWRVDEAVQIGRGLEPLGLAWIEDPTRHDDYRGLAQITAALSTPILAGESHSGVAPFRLMLEARSVDIVMIDVMMAGGITAWLQIAGMAEAFNIPVVSHILPEFQAQLVAGVPNGLVSEFKSWIWELFDEVPAFENGFFLMPERPGLGLNFNRHVYGDDW